MPPAFSDQSLSRSGVMTFVFRVSAFASATDAMLSESYFEVKFEAMLLNSVSISVPLTSLLGLPEP
jgi:hypothetical protein